MKNYITLLVAPNIPCAEVLKLRKRWDKKRIIGACYEVDVRFIDLLDARKGKILIAAPNVPWTEVKALRKHIKHALKDPSYTIVVNYEVDVRVVSE
jgi:hypothetical protein